MKEKKAIPFNTKMKSSSIPSTKFSPKFDCIRTRSPLLAASNDHMTIESFPTNAKSQLILPRNNSSCAICKQKQPSASTSTEFFVTFMAEDSDETVLSNESTLKAESSLNQTPPNFNQTYPDTTLDVSTPLNDTKSVTGTDVDGNTISKEKTMNLQDRMDHLYELMGRLSISMDEKSSSIPLNVSQQNVESQTSLEGLIDDSGGMKSLVEADEGFTEVNMTVGDHFEANGTIDEHNVFLDLFGNREYASDRVEAIRYQDEVYSDLVMSCPSSWLTLNCVREQKAEKKHVERNYSRRKINGSCGSLTKTRYSAIGSPRMLISSNFLKRFRMFSSYMDGHNSSGILINKFRSNVWLKSAGLIDETFTESLAGQDFASCAGRKVAMNIYDYIQYLKVVSLETKLTIENVISRLSTCNPPPQRSSKIPSSSTTLR